MNWETVTLLLIYAIGLVSGYFLNTAIRKARGDV